MSCETGCAPVECKTCGQRKGPLGRSVPMAAANSYCGHDCPGYRQDPQPCDLWPGECRACSMGPGPCATHPPEVDDQ